jgi:hypothetical protein
LGHSRGIIIGKNESELKYSVNRHFAKTLASMILFRGLKAEEELLCHFGEYRLYQLLNGCEPRFVELLTISDILSLPLTSFQLNSPGDFEEFDIAYAEILYTAHTLDQEGRAKLVREMLNLVSVGIKEHGLCHKEHENSGALMNGGAKK